MHKNLCLFIFQPMYQLTKLADVIFTQLLCDTVVIVACCKVWKQLLKQHCYCFCLFLQLFAAVIPFSNNRQTVKCWILFFCGWINSSVNVLTTAMVIIFTCLTVLVDMISNKCPAVVCLLIHSKLMQNIGDSSDKWSITHSELFWHVGLGIFCL